jgi:hypothetical protein
MHKRFLGRPSKNHGDMRQVEDNDRHNAQPHVDDDEQLLDDEELLRAPNNHAGGAWKYQARAAMVHATIEAKKKKKKQ